MELKGKRLAGIDFGLKRVGIAVCDPLHITVSPLAVLDFKKNDFWKNLLQITEKEKIEAFVVGIPVNDNNNSNSIIPEIENFIKNLQQKTNLSVYTIDESFSSKQAARIMVEIGTKKSKRKEKSSLDRIAAAIILQNFINEL